MTEGRYPVAGEEESASADVLYAAELVHDRGAYVVIVRDLTRGTRQTTKISKRMVGKIPVFLSKLDLQQY